MTLIQAFQKGNPRRTKWDGRTVHSYMRLNVADGDALRIRRIRASSVRAQSIKLAVDRGDLRAHGIVVPSIAIWSHTAPEKLRVEIVGRRARTVDLWNSWSFEGVDSAWLGNAGMLIESTGSAHLLKCSDGLGDPSFEDLIVRIEHIRNG